MGALDCHSPHRSLRRSRRPAVANDCLRVLIPPTPTIVAYLQSSLQCKLKGAILEVV